MEAHVNQIAVYPMKSCDPLARTEAGVLPSGSLIHDRQFALVDAEGRFINAKRTPAIHRLRLTIDPVLRSFHVHRNDGSNVHCGNLEEHGKELSDWLSDFFSMDVSLVENEQTGFPDDLISSGPTIVSTATLQTVADWFAPMSLDEARLRFRANIEVDGVEPFWEDRLFRADRMPQPVNIGGVRFDGVNPCQRCSVPSRNPLTGEVTPNSFAKRFGEQRQATLPPWAAREHFDHFYRLSTNTRLIELGSGVIRVGDPVSI